jgi:plastocyanin
MARIRLVVPVLLLGITTLAAAAPSVTSADSPPTVTIHEGGDPTSWGYTPTSTTVAVGQSVTWTNAGAYPHDAAATDGSWKTPLLDPGASATVTFASPGTYTYICTPHPWMQATIVVTAAASAAPTAAPTVAPTAAPADASVSQPAPAPAPQGDTTSTQPANDSSDSESDSGN